MKKIIFFIFIFLCFPPLAGCAETETAPAPGTDAAGAALFNLTRDEPPAPEDEPPENSELSESTAILSESETPAEKIPMLMLSGELYCDTGEVSTEPRCGMPDGQIASSVEAWERPSEDGQSNFGSGFGWQSGHSGDTVEVNVDGVWHVFQKRSTLRVRYCDTWFDASDVSDETLRWLLWFNSLDADAQMCVSFMPGDLYELCGYPSAEDIAAVDAQG